jgi:cold shock CspA family protein
MIDAKPARGRMLWFNEEKGHGFISTDDGERLYVAASGFSESPPVGPCAGLMVEFHVASSDDGRRAEETRLVAEVSPRRARLRRSR